MSRRRGKVRENESGSSELAAGRLTGDELYLLSLLVEHPWSLGLLAHPRLDVVTNQRLRPLARPAFEQAFLALLQNGLVEVREKGFSRSSKRVLVTPPDAALQLLRDEAARHRSEWRASVQLTARGAARWESFVVPDWSKFCRYDQTDDQVTLTCMSRNWLERYLRVMHARNGLPEDLQAIGARLRQIGRWKATYWKTLDSGYRVRFRAADTTHRYPPELVTELAGLAELHCSRAWSAIDSGP